MKSLALSLLFLGFLGSPAAGASSKPNLIVILADDLGWADLSSYGNTYNQTPNIDRLVQQGMRFTQAYAGPVCSPTRANLQSGQDQARFGITQHIPGHRRPYAKMIDPVVASNLPLEVETFAERIGAAGYRTGYFGKWHLGGPGFSPTDQGWQTALEIQGNTVPVAIGGGTEPRRMTEFLTEKAVAFIESAKGQPFLLQVSHYAVHIPLSTTPALLKKYQDRKPMPGYPSNPQYAGLLEELDQSVGKITETVDRLGLGENTLIVFISDNGGLEHEQSGRVVTSNQPLRGEKGSLYEGGIRIPTVVRWTGKVPAKTTCDTPIITMDWHPTLTALAGASAKKAQPQDGVSLTQLIMNPRASLSRDTLTWHLPHYHHSTPASAIRRGDWKLIEFFEDGALELYNLANDLGEKNNLARREPARTKELQTALAAWRQKVGAQMPVPNPQHDPARASELGKGPSRKKAQ
jgi:arylsulfatase A